MAVLVAFETERPEIDGRVVACVAAKQHAAEFEGEEAARPLVGVEFDAVFRDHGGRKMLDRIIDCSLSWGNPRNAELVKNEKYLAVHEKYMK